MSDGSIEVCIDHNCEKCLNNWTKKTIIENLKDDVEIICPECGSDKTKWSVWIKVDENFLGSEILSSDFLQSSIYDRYDRSISID